MLISIEPVCPRSKKEYCMLLCDMDTRENNRFRPTLIC